MKKRYIIILVILFVALFLLLIFLKDRMESSVVLNKEVPEIKSETSYSKPDNVLDAVNISVMTEKEAKFNFVGYENKEYGFNFSLPSECEVRDVDSLNIISKYKKGFVVECGNKEILQIDYVNSYFQECRNESCLEYNIGQLDFGESIDFLKVKLSDFSIMDLATTTFSSFKGVDFFSEKDYDHNTLRRQTLLSYNNNGFEYILITGPSMQIPDDIFTEGKILDNKFILKTEKNNEAINEGYLDILKTLYFYIPKEDLRLKDREIICVELLNMANEPLVDFPFFAEKNTLGKLQENSAIGLYKSNNLGMAKIERSKSGFILFKSAHPSWLVDRVECDNKEIGVKEENDGENVSVEVSWEQLCSAISLYFEIKNVF